MIGYKVLKFKMKLAFEAWNRSIEVISLIHFGILKTIQQKMAISTLRLKKFIYEKKFNEQHRLYSENEDSIHVYHKNPNKKRLCEHVKIMSHNIAEGYLDDLFRQENLKLEMRKKNYINVW